jgi:phosphosulfolactate phosphohydrolase-like enzyme
MQELRTVGIGAVSERPLRYPECDAVVLVDVICDTSTLVTAVAKGQPVYVAASAPAALQIARGVRDPLLGAEAQEAWRPGFEFFNSPVRLNSIGEPRPLVLACGVGAALAENGHAWPDVYLACFRNMTATARHLAEHHRHVLLLFATGDDARCEDQIAAARIGRCLVEQGFKPRGLSTRETLDRWGAAEVSLASWGRSAEQLRQQGRQEDLAFVLHHVDDLDLVCAANRGRVAAFQPVTASAMPVTA